MAFSLKFRCDENAFLLLFKLGAVKSKLFKSYITYTAAHATMTAAQLYIRLVF